MKALILYTTGQSAHADDVQTAFEAGGGVNSDTYEVTTFNQTVVDYAKTNGYDAIIYSYTGEESYFTLANSNPDVMIFMPSDSYSGALQQLVLTDNSPSTDDYEFVDATQDSQSNSNGYICGQLFYIAAQRQCSLQEARIVAGLTATNKVIDVDTASAYSGAVNLTIGSLTASRTTDFSVTVTLGRVIDATHYKIYRKEHEDEEFSLIATQTTITYSDTIPDYGIYEYKYLAYNSNLTSSFSDSVYVRYGAGTLLVA